MDLLLQRVLLYLGYIQATYQNFNEFLSLIAQKWTLNLQVKTDKKKGVGDTYTEFLPASLRYCIKWEHFG